MIAKESSILLLIVHWMKLTLSAKLTVHVLDIWLIFQLSIMGWHSTFTCQYTIYSHQIFRWYWYSSIIKWLLTSCQLRALSPWNVFLLESVFFFVIGGLVQFPNSIIITPLSLKQLWASEEMVEHPPVISMASLPPPGPQRMCSDWFPFAAKKYIWVRDGGLFRQQEAEDSYDI